MGYRAPGTDQFLKIFLVITSFVYKEVKFKKRIKELIILVDITTANFFLYILSKEKTKWRKNSGIKIAPMFKNLIQNSPIVLSDTVMAMAKPNAHIARLAFRKK